MCSDPFKCVLNALVLAGDIEYTYLLVSDRGP